MFSQNVSLLESLLNPLKQLKIPQEKEKKKENPGKPHSLKKILTK